MKEYRIYLLLFIAVFIVAACQHRPKEPEMQEQVKQDEAIEVDKESNEVKPFEVELMDQEGVEVGTATFVEDEDGVHIAVNAHHLIPGEHGFHIHEKGICATPDFESAGGHYNPEGKEHGFDNPRGPHAGDMENLEVNEDGIVEQLVINNQITLEKGKPNSLFTDEGTALMIHSNPDDYVSQPAGNAGERVACGVISKKKK